MKNDIKFNILVLVAPIYLSIAVSLTPSIAIETGVSKQIIAATLIAAFATPVLVWFFRKSKN